VMRGPLSYHAFGRLVVDDARLVEHEIVAV
jgi:hypothetical protein